MDKSRGQVLLFSQAYNMDRITDEMLEKLEPFVQDLVVYQGISVFGLKMVCFYQSLLEAFLPLPRCSVLTLKTYRSPPLVQRSPVRTANANRGGGAHHAFLYKYKNSQPSFPNSQS